MPQVERDVTLICVSNDVGGDLVGNARWQGVDLRDLLARAGVPRSGVMLVGRSVDGFTAGFPVELLDDDRPALLALAMNGEPLPARHGFPARLVIGGLYGYVSATKWLAGLDVVAAGQPALLDGPRLGGRRPGRDHLTDRRPRRAAPPWPPAPSCWPGPPGRSRAASPRCECGSTTARGSPRRWPTELTPHTWRMWRRRWEATPGRHRVAVRAPPTAEGGVQDADRPAGVPRAPRPGCTSARSSSALTAWLPAGNGDVSASTGKDGCRTGATRRRARPSTEATAWPSQRDSDRYNVITDGLPSQLPDIDPSETRGVAGVLDAVVDERGRRRARYLMLRMLERSRERQVGVPALRSTDYVNTIPPEAEPWFPGDEDIERRIRAYIRWNAAIMVSRANRPGLGVGGHIATYASSASLYEVGFNHFFQGKDHGESGDQVFIQGHGSPGIYARAFLEGRLTEERLDGFRQESRPDGGLPSYPHPRLMPDFWEFPTVSMGLGPIDAIYQARFNRYLYNRKIADTSRSHVWAFLGDGEMDEPECLGAIGVAAREELDNLTFVVNCNLQRLDGPVRGNGKIIQELESYFRGAGWNVIKVVWGRQWDPLLARDVDGVLVNAMNSTPDGQFQTYSVEDGSYTREHFFGTDPRLRKMVADLTDDDLRKLPRGGHDYRKVYAAFKAAREHEGQPTVILAKTVKGWTLGSDFEGRNSTHQMKKLTKADLKGFRDRLYLDIPDSALEGDLPPYFHPGEDSEEIAYLKERRHALGGYLPKRRAAGQAAGAPGRGLRALHRPDEGLRQAAGRHHDGVRPAAQGPHQGQGPRARTSCRSSRTRPAPSAWTRSSRPAKIYSPHGQQYEAVDRDLLLSYKESAHGPDPARGDQRGRLDGLGDRGRDLATPPTACT